MFDNVSLRKKSSIFLLIAFGLACLVCSCTSAPTKTRVTAAADKRPATLESINVSPLPSHKGTTIEITSSGPAPYTAFKLAQPLRLVVDITAVPGKGLTEPSVSDDRIIKTIGFESIKGKTLATRVTAALSQDVEYDVQAKEGIILVLLSPKEPTEAASRPVLAVEEEKTGAKEPRIFFAPRKTSLNQVLGIDFFMLQKGKSRVTVTTSKKADYELGRKDPFTLLLDIKEATIPAELTRYIDSSHFEGVVNRITPIVKPAERKVDLEIALKEMVPYHVMQAENEIKLDFSKTSVRPPARSIRPVKLTEGSVERSVGPRELLSGSDPQKHIALKPKRKKYTGTRMTLDFANADIRNILKLIGEVSKLNLVWGPEAKGTVSMRLKNVPWDQALDIVLQSNELDQRREGNIIWKSRRLYRKDYGRPRPRKRS